MVVIPCSALGMQQTSGVSCCLGDIRGSPALIAVPVCFSILLGRQLQPWSALCHRF